MHMNTSLAAPASVAYSSETELFAGLQAGERHALKQVYKECWPMVAGFVRQNNGDKTDAEELFQEAILVLYEKTRNPDFQLTCSIKTYLYAVCRNRWLNQLRNSAKTTPIDEEAEAVADEFLQEKERVPLDQDLTQALDKLGEPCRQVLLGYYFEKLSLEQLAIRLGYASANVVKQRKFKCLERMKKMFLTKEYNLKNG